MWIALAATIGLNALFEITRLGGVTSADVSDQVFTWFTPAGYVFAIWTVIYAALALWLVRYPKSMPAKAQGFNVTSILFIASCALNVIWLAVWHFQLIGASLGIIFALWIVLALLYVQTRRTATSRFGWMPISIYVSWVTVATIANAASLVTRMMTEDMPLLGGISTVLIVIGVLAAAFIMKKVFHDPIAPLVALWAIVGVGVHLWTASFATALIVFALAAVGAVFTYLDVSKLHKTTPKPKSKPRPTIKHA